MARLLTILLFCVVALPAAATAQQPENVPGALSISVDPLEATVGDRIAVELRLTLDGKTRFDPPELGPALGNLSVVEGAWSRAGTESAEGWLWRGEVVAFRPGEQTIPPIKLTLIEDADEGESRSLSTEEVTLTILSVLEENADESLADLKPPVQVPPDYGALRLGATILALALLFSALLWWLQRRYASKLARAELITDPFLRIPPHEWVYAELQKLLDRRLAEQGEVELFFAELARIVKLYLGGRFRCDLLERTSAEVPIDLAQSGAGDDAIERVSALLDRCDAVKFARVSPPPESCREAIEQAYAIVDLTRPQIAGRAEGASSVAG